MSEPSDLPELQPAASLIVFRQGGALPEQPPELLMVRRGDALTFGGGATVFPGGKVDPADLDLARTMPGDIDWNAARIACVRETLEETGLLLGVRGAVDADMATSVRTALDGGAPLGSALAAHDLALDVEHLVPFARWHPPGRVVRRFDTRFLLADIGTGAVTLSADGSETAEQFWATASDLLAMADEGRISLMFPTRANITRLARFASFAAAREESGRRGVVPVTGKVVERDGVRWLTVTEGGGYDGYAEPLATAMRGDGATRD